MSARGTASARRSAARASTPIDRPNRASPLWKLSARHRALLVLLAADTPLSYRDISYVLDMPIGSIGPTRSRLIAAVHQTFAAGDGEATAVASRVLRDLDPPPPVLDVMARAACAAAAGEADVATLSYDSALDRDIEVRSGHGAIRLLAFAFHDIVIKLRISDSGENRQIVGRTSLAAPPGVVDAWSPKGCMGRAVIDVHGYFTVEHPPYVPVALRLDVGRPRPLETEWVLP